MRNYIEKILLEKTQNSRSNIFYTQWQVAKKYVPLVLNTISHTFPHYSLHDSTHSDTIINNIVRIVGKDVIDKFSSIDLWLLLSAAYYHDIGMAVFAKDLCNEFNGDEFKEFLSEIQNDKRSSLYDYANLLEIKDDKVYYNDCEFNSKSYEGSRFLIAEYIRRKHGERSKDSIKQNTSINLPGNPIPTRIINILSNICLSHSRTFKEVMNLPFSETSIDFEDCHPRYIACLLRLGDLLDLDNNRFSEVLLQTLNNIPLDSMLHDEKHRSIDHIRVDKQRIEIKATCEKYEVADITNRWFQFLNDEISIQMKKWNEIVPSVEYGFLPTLGDLEVELKDYDTIDGKLRPSFSIDPQKSIELLQGAGLYNEPYQSIRELLQNAVDATFIRIWAETKNKDIYNRDDFSNDCKKYPISIDIKEDKDNKDADKVIWDITITDYGIGMSKEDICYLTTTGSSNKNKEKKKRVDSMPEWMKPSGTFGIGFQSVFLLTDKVNIETRKLNRENVLNIELNNPIGEKEGAVLIKTKFSADIEVGTILNFRLETQKIPERLYYKFNHKLVSKLISSYDFVKDKSLDIDITKIIDEIYSFNYSSCVRVELMVNDKQDKFLDKQIIDFKYFSEENNLEIGINLKKMYILIYYRNQLVQQFHDFDFLGLNINILGGNANDIVTLSRNGIKTEYKSKFMLMIIDSLLNIMPKMYCDLDPPLKQMASMFIYSYFTDEILNKLFNSGYDDWENYIFKYRINENGNGEISLEKLFSSYNNIVFIFQRRNMHIKPALVKENKGDSFCILESSDYNPFLNFIKYICSKKGFMYLSFDKYNDGRKIIASKFDNHGVYLKDIMLWLIRYKRNTDYSRGLMPCNQRYQKLELSDKFNLPFADDNTFSSFHIKYPIMICPYVRKFKDDDKYLRVRSLDISCDESLYDLVFKYRKDPNTTIDEIKDTYKMFLEDTKIYLEEINKEPAPKDDL